MTFDSLIGDFELIGIFSASF